MTHIRQVGLILVFGVAIGCEEPVETAAPLPYSDSMIIGGQAFDLMIHSAEPGTPSVGVNRWTISVTRAGETTPLESATIVMEPTMPHHGHGTSPAITSAVALADDPGRYTVDNINLFMAGVWQLRVVITVGEQTDTLVFAFDTDAG